MNRTMDGRSTRPTLSTPGTRISTTATRTTTTRALSSGPGPSADRSATQGHADFSTLGDLIVAYRDCRRTKRNTASALAFEQNLERNLVELHEDLAAGSYRPGRSICFINMRPKPREVWAAEFRDRVVHHLLYNRIGARIEASFIADSCACIPGRGTLYAARRLEAKIRSATENWTRPVHYLKCDIASFFVAIDKRILGAQLERRIHEPWWRALALQVLFHDPREGATFQSSAAEMALVPPHKSLLNQPAHLGLPIGNLSSQFFANIYLDVLDQHVKHRLRARHYIRYVDDFILLDESPQQLNAWRVNIEALVREQLHIELNAGKTVLQPVARGVDFAGHVIRPYRRTIRRRTFNDALYRVAALSAADVHQTTNSYFGLLRQATASHNDRVRLARLVMRRGHAVDLHLTKAYRHG